MRFIELLIFVILILLAVIQEKVIVIKIAAIAIVIFGAGVIVYEIRNFIKGDGYEKNKK